MCVCCVVCVEVRGQLPGFLSPPCGSQGWTQAVVYDKRPSIPLSHLAELLKSFLQLELFYACKKKMIYTVQRILAYHIYVYIHTHTYNTYIYIYSDPPEFNIFHKYSIITKIRELRALACSWNPDPLEPKQEYLSSRTRTWLYSRKCLKK